jgi:hypothetical protein
MRLGRSSCLLGTAGLDSSCQAVLEAGALLAALTATAIPSMHAAENCQLRQFFTAITVQILDGYLMKMCHIIFKGIS